MMYRVEDCTGPIPFGIEVYEKRKPTIGERAAALLRWLAYGVLATALGATILLAMVLFPAPARSQEIGFQVGDASWSKCSGKACWDQSGDPDFALPARWRQDSTMLALQGRAAELEVSLQWTGIRNAVQGRYVDDRFFDEHRRRVRGCPTRVIDAAVDQWQAGMRVVWAPRWRLLDGVDGQLEVGAYVHHTRWAINWRNQGGARGDGGDWGVTPTGGARLLFAGPGRAIVTAGVEAYHHPTVQTAPLGGGRGPGLVVWGVGVRWQL